MLPFLDVFFQQGVAVALFSLIAVLLIEQIRPLPYRQLVYKPLAFLAGFLEERFNAGERNHGMVAWLIGVGGLVLVAGSVYAVLNSFSPLLAWLWNVLMLYLTLGFRQFSHYYTEIQLALRMDDLPHARTLLAEWRGVPAEAWSSREIARQAIQEAFAAAHHHVFAVLVCFMVLPGPCGAVLYRAAAFFARHWGERAGDDEVEVFGSFSRQAFAVIDWLPARLTAAGFAIVGNFEDAIYCWKTQAGQGMETSGNGTRIVQASGAGALGVRLGMPAMEAGSSAPGDSLRYAVGEEADADFMQSAVGLVWRALLLWLLLLSLLALSALARL